VEPSRRLEALRKLQRLLDDAYRLPGTNLRFGWDPIIGLVPWVGDLLTAALSCAIIVQAHQMRVPGIVQLRMMLNVAIDLAVGAIPLAGDVADVFWKSNARNFAILEHHAAEPQPATPGDWLFVGAIALGVMAAAIVPLAILYALVQFLVSEGWLR
jgi:hypothetical protein